MAPEPRRPSLLAMAVAVGVSAATPFYGQALLPAVQADFQLAAGLVLLGPMATQLGMALGFLLVLPLSDASERRRTLELVALGLALSALSVLLVPSFAALLVSWWVLGLFCLIPALLPPFLAALTPPAQRGRMLGLVLSGQFSGILLSRSVSGVLAQAWGWRTVYGLAGGLMLLVLLLIRRQLPQLQPSVPFEPLRLQRSLLALWGRHGRLRRACLSQALLFGAFMALWSGLALHLAGPPWRYGPGLIGSFGLVGVVSIVAAPGVGRAVDRHGPERIVAGGALTTGLGAVLLLALPHSLAALALGLVAVDLGVQGSFVANQARIHALDPLARSRMSGLLFLTAYAGAAVCSALAVRLWPRAGWGGLGMLAVALAVLVLLLEWNGHRRRLP
ncbi:MAG: MFS transporter [Cyanobacteriota bacterium]|nr:MFS transporter [Cyanobacteriota bacterium]